MVIDKPAGITSHDVVSRVRRILGTRKVGHTGTLDPFATGVLPIAVNDGTKVIPFLDEGIKCYEAVMRLGVTTDTLDMTGTVLHSSDSSRITRLQLESALTSFTGSLQQVPPMYSAIKRDGQPLYKLARQGVDVERLPRSIEIKSLELISFQEQLATISVSCSRGTYIRSLADDIGHLLGCGAALQELRRTASGPFSLVLALSLDALEIEARQGGIENFVISPCAALGHLIGIQLSETDVEHVRHGRIPVDEGVLAGLGDARPHALVRLMNAEQLAAVAEIQSDAAMQPRIRLKRVFM